MTSDSRSFLRSLSDELPVGILPHPEAILYKEEYINRKEELGKHLYSLFNTEVFNHQLPENIVIVWSSRLSSTSGFCYLKQIERDNLVLRRTAKISLSIKIVDRASRLRDTLIHEMCHAATWIINGIKIGHGAIWKSWAKKANDMFPELPRIQTYHSYNIEFKYKYKCVGCGYRIGRHQRSRVLLARKRCGFCLQRFELLPSNST